MKVSMIIRHRLAAGRRFLPLIALTASVAIGFSIFAFRTVNAQGERSVNNGIYTPEQAKRGEQIFDDVGRCYICHLRTLQGDLQQGAMPLVGPVFQASFSGKSVDDLFYKIRYTMPADLGGRGTLPLNQVSDLIAYILQKNGYPEGIQDLTTDRSQLKMIRFEVPKQTSGAMPPSSGGQTMPSY